ncbi:MAG: hypothetical protein AAFQ43_06730 [Bacteroidota bacterium]
MARSRSRRDRRDEPLAPEAAERMCIECGGPMEEGFVIDATHGGQTRPVWAEGEPVTSIWTGLKLKGKQQYYVQTFRCAHCGALREYALEVKS